MNRRQFLQTAGGVIIGTGMLVHRPLVVEKEKTAENRPNILFINVDDMGWTDLGFMGSSYYETPHIDKLASEGRVFTDAYAPAANCAPSRACVFTGQYGPRHGVYTVGSSERGSARFRKLIPTPNMKFIGEENITFAALLKEAGYATVHLGKWHISPDPLENGFEVNFGGYEAGHPTAGYFSPYNNPALSDGPKGEYLTDRLVDEAIGYLNSRDKNRPFLMSMQFYTVHTPIQAKSEVVEKYRAKLSGPAHFNPTYAAMIEHLDTNVGRLLDAVDKLGLRDDTLVLFTSDNGGIYNISRQSPLRGEKGSYYEGGIRVPMAVRWPGKVRPRTVCHTPVSGIDFFPTFLDAAGVSVPRTKTLDGASLMPLLTDTKELPKRPLFWHFPVYLQAYGQGNVETRDPLFRTRPGSAMRLGRWKLQEYFEDGGLELYDLQNDIGERRNLAEMLPDTTKQLHQILKDWRRQTHALVPSEPNPRYSSESEASAIRAFYDQSI